MKTKDIGLILVIAIISGTLSIFLSNFLFSSSSNRSVEVEVVTPFQSDFNRPPETYFNPNSINPTQTIQIGTNQVNNPFGQE